MQSPGSQWEREILLLYIPTIAKYSVEQKLLFGPQGTQGQFLRFAVMLFTCQERILSSILGFRGSFMQNMWTVFQASTGTQASLYSRKFPAMLESYVLFCVISHLPHSGLINSPVCSSMVTWMTCPKTEQELLLLSLSGSRNLVFFLQTTIA